MESREGEHQNWAKTVAYSSKKVLKPKTVEELQGLLRDPMLKHVKVQGTGHSFNLIADTNPNGVFVSLQHFKDIQVDDRVVHFGAGVTYSELIAALVPKKRALRNVPSLPHINVVGGMITATHGAGYNQPIQAEHVVAIDVVHADGSFSSLHRDRDADVFWYYIHGFGSIGIITRMTISVEPEFQIFKAIY